MIFKKITVSFLLLILCLSFAFAGGSQEVVADGPQEETESYGMIEVDYKPYEIGKSGGRFVMSVLSDPKTFNNALASETSTSDITYRLYDALVKRDQVTLEWAPLCAESWEFSEDNKTLTLHVRKDLKWSDGTPCDASDWVFTFNHVNLQSTVEGNSRDGSFVNEKPVIVKLIDDYTLSITADTVYAGMLNIAYTHPVPKHIFGPLIGWTEEMGYDYKFHWEDGEVVEENPYNLDYNAINSYWGLDCDVTTIVGNGPFVLGEFVAGQKVVLKKNPHYFMKDAAGTRLPYFDEVVLLTVSDQDTQLAKFQAGELDRYNMRGEDYAILVDKMEELNFNIYNTGSRFNTQFITFNQNLDATEVDAHILKWTNNKKFRTAMAHLVDRETIVNNIAYGFGLPQYSFVPRCSPYYWEKADEVATKFNPDKAKEILDGLKIIDRDGDGIREDEDGNKISMRMTTNSGNRVRESIGELFAQEAKKIGIEVNFQPEDFNVMVGKLLSGSNWDIILIGLTGSVDPISGVNVYPSSGNLHMNEPNQVKPRREWERQVDEAWKVANNTIDENQRKTGWTTIQKIWIDELPWIYTFNETQLTAYNAGLGNIYSRPMRDYSWDGILQYMYWK